MNRRLSWLIALIIIVASGALMGLVGSGDSAEQSPVPVPIRAESARADAARTEFPGGDRVPAILVVSRADGATLTPTDLEAADQARQRMLAFASAGTDRARRRRSPRTDKPRSRRCLCRPTCPGSHSTTQ